MHTTYKSKYVCLWFPHSQSHSRSLSQYKGIRRWGLWEKLVHEGGASLTKLVPQKNARWTEVHAVFSLSHAATDQEVNLTRNWNSWHLGLGLVGLWNYET